MKKINKILIITIACMLSFTAKAEEQRITNVSGFISLTGEYAVLTTYSNPLSANTVGFVSVQILKGEKTISEYRIYGKEHSFVKALPAVLDSQTMYLPVLNYYRIDSTQTCEIALHKLSWNDQMKVVTHRERHVQRESSRLSKIKCSKVQNGVQLSYVTKKDSEWKSKVFSLSNELGIEHHPVMSHRGDFIQLGTVRISDENVLISDKTVFSESFDIQSDAKWNTEYRIVDYHVWNEKLVLLVSTIDETYLLSVHEGRISNVLHLYDASVASGYLHDGNDRINVTLNFLKPIFQGAKTYANVFLQVKRGYVVDARALEYASDQGHPFLFGMVTDGRHDFVVYKEVMNPSSEERIGIQIQKQPRSKIEFVQKGGGIAQSVYPNPVHDKLSIGFTLSRRGNVSLALLDLAGRVVRTTEATRFNRGNHVLAIDVSGLDKAIYTVQLNNGQNVESYKVVVD